MKQIQGMTTRAERTFLHFQSTIFFPSFSILLYSSHFLICKIGLEPWGGVKEFLELQE